MKILSLNLHCMQEDNINEINNKIASEILKNDIDIVLLQEVAQHKDDKIVSGNIKASNQGYLITKLLKNDYNFIYKISNLAFGVYDEGIGIITRLPFENIQTHHLSKIQDYNNYLTRLTLSIDVLLRGIKYTVCSAHLGWSEADETHQDQMRLLDRFLNRKNKVIVGGDFNVHYNKDEYINILSLGYRDLFIEMNEPLITYIGKDSAHTNQERIDYFFSKDDFKVVKSKVMFNDYRVSDHYGIYIEINEVE